MFTIIYFMNSKPYCLTTGWNSKILWQYCNRSIIIIIIIVIIIVIIIIIIIGF